MSITKAVNFGDGRIGSFHIVQNVVVVFQDGVENVFAVVQSWYEVKDFEADKNRPIKTQSIPMNITPCAGMRSIAEQIAVTSPDSFLFGGTVTPDVTQSDLDKAKDKKKAEIASAKNVEMYADKTTSLGVFGSSESDNNRLSIAIQIAQLSPAQECGYKDASGNWQMYTVTQLTQIALEIANQVLPLYAKESTLTTQVDAATTVAEVESINW